MPIFLQVLSLYEISIPSSMGSHHLDHIYLLVLDNLQSYVSSEILQMFVYIFTFYASISICLSLKKHATSGNVISRALQYLEPFVYFFTGLVIQASMDHLAIFFFSITCCEYPSEEISLQKLLAGNALPKRHAFLSPHPQMP